MTVCCLTVETTAAVASVALIIIGIVIGLVGAVTR